MTMRCGSTRGCPLAIDGGERTNAVHPVEHGDVVVLFSDGLVERRGESLDDGLARLCWRAPRDRAAACRRSPTA